MQETTKIPEILDDAMIIGLNYDDYHVAQGGYSSDTAILQRDNVPFAVVKTDKLDKGFTHRHTLNESLVVATLNEAAATDPPPLEIPVMIDSQVQLKPYYNAFSYVQGAILSYPDMEAFPKADKVAIGRQLAEAVYWIEKHVTPDTVPELDSRDLAPCYMLRYNALKSYAEIKDVLLCDELDFYVHALLDTLDRAADLFDETYLQARLCGHNELLAENITFMVQPQTVALRGIFDFGMAGRRPTEYDFRFLNFVSPYFTEGAAEKYHDLSGRDLDVDKMNAWSDIQALGPLMYRAVRQSPLEKKYAWYLERFKQRAKANRY